MNSIIKSIKIPNVWLKNNVVLVTAVRNHFNKDYLPGPYPKTEKERALAAKTYDLPLQEYQPLKDDGLGVGNYPDFPLISQDSKDPFYPWDNPEMKRNYNEVIHRHFDEVRYDRYDCNLQLRRPLRYLWLESLAWFGGLFGLYYVFDFVKMSLPTIPQQYPNQGKVHYTFELEDN